MLQEVMLAETFDPKTAHYPYLATPKIDGVRSYVGHGDVWTRSKKPLPNLHIRKELPLILPNGFDYELYARDFGSTTSQVMSDFCTPDITVFVLDYLPEHDSWKERYINRVQTYRRFFKKTGWLRHETLDDLNQLPYYQPPASKIGTYRICPLTPTWIHNDEQLENFSNSCLNAGHEGICLRTPQGPYVFGKRTEHLLKYKPRQDSEARIISFEELLSNQNEAFTNEKGRQARSRRSEGLVPAGTLGSMFVSDLKSGVRFNVGGGPGLTSMLRDEIWANRHKLTGKVIKYSHLPYGAKEKPRQPQFLGFRDERDL
jgi:DNA ligase 1